MPLPNAEKTSKRIYPIMQGKTLEEIASGENPTIDNTAKVRISLPISNHCASSPIGDHSVIFRPLSIQAALFSGVSHNVFGTLNTLSKNMGPSAACTVAFGIQAKAIKIFSFTVSSPPQTEK